MSRSVSKKWLPLCLGLCFVSSVGAQPLEEEEEPVQARPNPVEQSQGVKLQRTPVEDSTLNQKMQTQQIKVQGAHPGAAADKALGDDLADPFKQEAAH